MLAAFGMFSGAAAAVIGFGVCYAGSMSDCPDEGDRCQREGCAVSVVGVLLFCGSLLWLMLS